MSELITLIDGDVFSEELLGLNSNEKAFIYKMGIARRESEVCKLSFVGVFNLSDKVFICLPKTTSNKVSQEEIRSQAKLLIRCLVKFGNEYNLEHHNLQADRPKLDHQDKKGLDKIRLYLAILEDYKRYGLVKFIESKVREGTSGKINWKKTISKYLPVLNENKQPVYAQYQVKKNHISSNELIAEIHRHCVYQANTLLGWFSGQIHSMNQSHVDLPCTIKEAIHVIKKELEVEYETRRINLYNNLIKILSLDNEKLSGSILGVTNYWRIWEHMCSKVFNDVYKSKYQEQIPQPVYVDSENKIVRREGRIGQRFDIISELDGYLFLIDAKYYDVSSSLPGWGDIVKQFFYEKSLRLVSKKAIINILCFPEVTSNSKLPQKISMNSSNVAPELLLESFPTIHCEYLDVWKVVSAYVNYDSDENQHLKELLLRHVK